jgi:hypothetical protein
MLSRTPCSPSGLVQVGQPRMLTGRACSFSLSSQATQSKHCQQQTTVCTCANRLVKCITLLSLPVSLQGCAAACVYVQCIETVYAYYTAGSATLLAPAAAAPPMSFNLGPAQPSSDPPAQTRPSKWDQQAPVPGLLHTLLAHACKQRLLSHARFTCISCQSGSGQRRYHVRRTANACLWCASLLLCAQSQG